MPKEALVVSTDILFKEKHFEGFLSVKDFDFSNIILNNYFYHERGDKLEHDVSLQQIIPYVVIINNKAKKVFAYKRAPDERYTEVRLRNKFSIGIGGHVERQDDKNPIQSGMMRELMEEVKISEYPTPKIIGYINDDKGDVESVHFGILALAETENEVQQGDDEMVESGFYSIEEFESLIADSSNNLEGWSKIAWPVVKDYLLK